MEAHQSFDIPLHDIKNIVDVEEYSLYYLLGASAFALLVLLVVAYFFYMWFGKKDKFNLRKENYKALGSLDMSDAKKAAYALTFYGATFKDDSPRHYEMYLNLTKRLEVYKYKKEVSAFDDETKGYIELYRGMIDV
ncbi:hypothetical protein Suden_0655 [Sulfurimonas denitrificans DSM 1251]|jgi:hypothetical protein|uniref:DUF4381 domain-containing protein n=1 Tax=Sulfurimonas denitrificans (strain ATCC 33889 / DSM 1251) TaxID=326298 RepID=Q30SU7_SULDN|nr:hypothetical protein [Sulfurimonas denitrificans]ABB43934.1 hypothetical protein Suden_0655 [Sulfurimonas denitrificans DSM 1251]MDD3443591.1 hypothetical protein [Sulfurimonas denitrificans]